MAHHLLRDSGYLSDGHLQVRRGLKINLLDGPSLQGNGLDVLNVVYQCRQATLGVAEKTVGHLLRLHAGVLPDDADDWNIDFGKDVDRSAQKHDGSKDQNQQRHHHEGIRPP